MAVFSVGAVICLVTSFNDRDLRLLNHVKYDSYLITSEREKPFSCTPITLQLQLFFFF